MDEIPHEAIDMGHRGSLVDRDPGMGLRVRDEPFQKRRHRLALPGGLEVSSISPQPVRLLHQIHGIALAGQGQSCGEARHPAARHQGGTAQGKVGLLKGRSQISLGHGHPDQIDRLDGGRVRVFGVDPGIVVPDIGHLDEIFVQAGGDQGLLEKGLVGPGGAGGHHDPVEVVFRNPLGDEVLGVGGAGEEVVLHMGHVGQGPGVFRHRLHIHHVGDVDAAGADKDADARGLPARDVDLAGVGLDLGEAVLGVEQEPGRLAGAEDASATDWGMSLGPWKAPVTKTPGRVDRTGSKPVVRANRYRFSSMPNFRGQVRRRPFAPPGRWRGRPCRRARSPARRPR